MPQFGRPDATTTNDGLFTDQGGGSVNLHLVVDEVTADDADFIRSVATPTSDTIVFSLSDVTDPVSSTGHIIRMRTSTDLAAQEAIDFTQELRQGYVSEASQGTLIASQQRLGVTSATWTTSAYTLSGAEADAITNYADLFIRFIVNKP
jgi:hypothetical protein